MQVQTGSSIALFFLEPRR